MKNKGFIAFIFIFTALIGGAILVGTAQTASAYDDYGYGGYDDYGYGSYDSYGYDDYGYGSYDDYGYGGYDSYGYDDYDYGGYDDCYYDCYDYGYDYGYDYDDCYYDCYDYPEYDDCYYDCYDYPEYDDCHSCDAPVEREPVVIRNENNNSNISNNNNVNTNNIVIRNYSGGDSEPVRYREREYDREIERALICTPASQSAGVNQSVSLNVSGGNGTYAWSAPGSQNISGRGSSVQLRYPSAGLKTITVSSAGQSATCFVQVTGGQVLAEFIEFPNTGAGGINALMPNILAIGGSVLAGIIGLVYFVRRSIIA